ncbi:MAG: hypothetical protein AAF127_11815 [Pseudomonadota bacterium]
MKATYLTAAAALALTFGIAACSGEAPPPAPTPAPTPSPAASISAPPPPPPAPVVTEPTFENYLDAPQTPGTWEFEDEPGEKLALFGVNPRQPIFLMRCGEGRIALVRTTSDPQAVRRTMTVTTETTERRLQTAPVPGRQVPLLASMLDPNDPLLDAMAITKGRFKIAVDGERTLYLPAWAEVTRVIEDCR